MTSAGVPLTIMELLTSYKTSVEAGIMKAGGSSMTGGLVQTSKHSVLPSISPGTTAGLTFLAMTPVLYGMWVAPVGSRRARESFPKAVCYAMLCAFVLGYHVHEKHILQ